MITLDIDQIEIVPLPAGTKAAMSAFSKFINSLDSISHEEMRKYGESFARAALVGGSLRPSISRTASGECVRYSEDSLVEMAGKKALPLKDKA